MSCFVLCVVVFARVGYNVKKKLQGIDVYKVRYIRRKTDGGYSKIAMGGSVI